MQEIGWLLHGKTKEKYLMINKIKFAYEILYLFYYNNSVNIL